MICMKLVLKYKFDYLQIDIYKILIIFKRDGVKNTVSLIMQEDLYLNNVFKLLRGIAQFTL